MSVKKQYKSFAEMIESTDLPILVDFYAPWCGPCQMMSPILQNVGVTLKDQVLVVKINTDKNPQVATEWQIRELPTLMIFKDGKPVERLTGVHPAPEIMDLLQPWL
ncbi:thioredoxin [Candidatus Cyanaurora vandensis]|uniref:thioredoxin n=1 Tax=Candidatus Cyanaurora vandensis TaxID=2714958 RepID=UPI00257EDF1F|nr:thioredoxin [Candidatus Cyanaurora vandensis]